MDWAGGACAGSSGSFSGVGTGASGGAGGVGSSLGTVSGGAGAGGTAGGAAGSALSRLSGAPNFSSSRLSFSAQAARRSSCMRRSSSSRRRRARSTAREISDEDCFRRCLHASSSSSGAGGLPRSCQQVDPAGPEVSVIMTFSRDGSTVSSCECKDQALGGWSLWGGTNSSSESYFLSSFRDTKIPRPPYSSQ